MAFPFSPKREQTKSFPVFSLGIDGNADSLGEVTESLDSGEVGNFPAAVTVAVLRASLFGGLWRGWAAGAAWTGVCYLRTPSGAGRSDILL